MRGATQAQLKTFNEKFNALFTETFGTARGAEFILPHAIAGVLNGKSHDPHTIDSNWLQWSVDAYVAAKVGPLWPRLLALHQLLFQSKATPAKPYDFEHCDRYGVAYADADNFKTMALQTQNYTYFILLCKRRVYNALTDEASTVWATHIRVCTSGRFTEDWKRSALSSLKWLADSDKVAPIAYESGKDADDYFRYKDCRDRGYLISVEPELMLDDEEAAEWKTDRAINRYPFLSGVIYDLASHCDCLPEYAERLASPDAA